MKGHQVSPEGIMNVCNISVKRRKIKSQVTHYYPIRNRLLCNRNFIVRPKLRLLSVAIRGTRTKALQSFPEHIRTQKTPAACNNACKQFHAKFLCSAFSAGNQFRMAYVRTLACQYNAIQFEITRIT